MRQTTFSTGPPVFLGSSKSMLALALLLMLRFKR
jgi:hypothetical protein